MDLDGYLAQLAADGPRLADAAQRAGFDALVAATDWTVRDLVLHLGGIHRWAAAVVATASPTTEIAEGDAVGSGPGDAELLDWFRVGHAGLVRTLREAPADLECATFLAAPSPLLFWARRQAHETAVHRADAESALDPAQLTPFGVAFAQDGIAEMLHGFAARRSNAIATAGVLALRPDDEGDAWQVRLGGERVEATIGAAADAGATDADVVVSGTSSALYLWLWNRPAEVRVSGDAALAGLWREIRVRWS